MSNINSIRSKNQIYDNKNLQYVHIMYMQWNKCTKLSLFYKLCFVMGGRGDGSSKWYAYRNKHEGKSNTKMNTLTGIKMNTFSTPNRAKFLNNM